jgi:hypothetical protein
MEYGNPWYSMAKKIDKQETQGSNGEGSNADILDIQQVKRVDKVGSANNRLQQPGRHYGHSWYGVTPAGLLLSFPVGGRSTHDGIPCRHPR